MSSPFPPAFRRLVKHVTELTVGGLKVRRASPDRWYIQLEPGDYFYDPRRGPLFTEGGAVDGDVFAWVGNRPDPELDAAVYMSLDAVLSHLGEGWENVRDMIEASR